MIGSADADGIVKYENCTNRFIFAGREKDSARDWCSGWPTTFTRFVDLPLSEKKERQMIIQYLSNY